ncbi:MAG TPA: hypothetical protein VLL95_01600, partial [Phnomibacter sp.]|nr:hypothetical protein [Phnomibacter sp.]
MSQVRKIKVMAGNPADKSLTLVPKEVIAWRGDFIVWEIDPYSGVKSIDKIEMKRGAKNVFLAPPHANGKNWTAEIDGEANEDDVCTYSIIWTGIDGKRRVFDPIITIKPTQDQV